MRRDKPVFAGDSKKWAEQQFGRCDLGDTRRTRRVVAYAACQAENPTGSTNAVCAGDDAAAEGAYRMIRNSHIDPAALELGPFSVTAEECAKRKVVLAIQDTTTLTVKTSLADELGELGRSGSGGRGLLVHSTLAVDGDTGEPLGLLDQVRWQRSDKRPSKHTRKQRLYEAKESFKWEAASRRISDRVATMDHIITVCDREADIHEFLQHHVERNQRFVVRAAQDRLLEAEEGRLWEYIEQCPVICTYEVTVFQRGAQRRKGRSNRPARQQRTASLEIRSATVTLLPPLKKRTRMKPNRMNIVLTREVNSPPGETPMEWMILTSESIGTKQDAKTVIRYYERRWLVEQFHKCWKTGCRIEQRPVQAVDNLHRLAVITAHVAIRLLQLRLLADSKPDQPCESIMTPDEWHCLWATVEHDKRPRRPPSVLWALRALAKLAGWRDTKRTGRVGWETLWKGWAKLEDRVAGWKLAREPM